MINGMSSSSALGRVWLAGLGGGSSDADDNVNIHMYSIVLGGGMRHCKGVANIDIKNYLAH